MPQYTTIRQQLLDRQAKIQARLQKITSDVQREQEPLSPDFAEQAVQRENDEVLSALDDSLHEEIAQIETTLARLAQGAYEKCAVCGKKISAQRLKALPYTSRCVSCAGKEEF